MPFKNLPDWVKQAVGVVGLLLLIPLVLVWAWDNLFVVLGAPAFTYANGVALELWGVLILCCFAVLKEVK